LVKKNIVVFGSSSEFAKEFIKLCNEKNYNLFLISRSQNHGDLTKNLLVINDYLREFDKIKKFLIPIENKLVYFFNGALFENRPIKYPSQEEVQQTKYINYYLPLELTKKSKKEIKNIDKFIYISSMAAIKPRYKNFIYGQNKKKLEISIKKEGVRYLIIRYGKIFTKMSDGHKTPPFSLSAPDAAKILIKKIDKRGVVYPNFGLFLISILIKVTPSKLINLIKL
tara:strand:- start:84 stop:758 length:675 start_codon:yes stop_codon:yes gene_type:complete